MKTSRKLLLSSVLVLALGLSGCVAKTPPSPVHKVKTTACLIRSAHEVPGNPDKQLATDLVEAKVVYGLNVREVKIDNRVSNTSTALLKALQGGCVLMVSSNLEYLNDLAQFAGEHPKMLVLFVGGSIVTENQPKNFRWVADDLLGGAKLAGYLAAGKSTSGVVHLLMQPAYYQAKKIEAAFRAGVKDSRLYTGRTTKVLYSATRSAADLSSALAGLVSTDVAVVFAGRSVWLGFPEESAENPFVLGADLQPGTSIGSEPSIQVSLERNTSKYVLSAVASLLNGKVSSDPLYRKPGALKVRTIDLSILNPDSLDGALLDAIAAYRQELATSSSR